MVALATTVLGRGCGSTVSSRLMAGAGAEQAMAGLQLMGRGVADPTVDLEGG